MDENKIKNDKLPTFMYGMCHMKKATAKAAKYNIAF